MFWNFPKKLQDIEYFLEIPKIVTIFNNKAQEVEYFLEIPKIVCIFKIKSKQKNIYFPKKLPFSTVLSTYLFNV